jgi:hypothetical protein
VTLGLVGSLAVVTDHRRLPTSILVLVAAVLLGPGAVWWFGSAPAQPQAAPMDPGAPTSVVIQLDNGAVLAYGTDSTMASGDPSQQLATLERIVETQWPCRIDRRGGSRPGWATRDAGDFVGQDARVVLLPHCRALDESLRFDGGR